METLEFAAVVVSMNIIACGMAAVQACKWLDNWVRDREEKYLYGENE
jgi:hypothetical protein